MGCESSTPVGSYGGSYHDRSSSHHRSYTDDSRYRSRTERSYERSTSYKSQPAPYVPRSSAVPVSTGTYGGPTVQSSSVAGAPQSAAKMLTKEDVAKHRTAQDCWIILDGQVYDVTAFLRSHPGCSGAILPFAGRDITRASYSAHSYVNFSRTLARWHKGALAQA